jgi:hypothetical protein
MLVLLTTVKALLVEPIITRLEVLKLEPVMVMVPPVRGTLSGEIAEIIGTNGKVITGLPCQFTESEVVPAKATTTEKL